MRRLPRPSESGCRIFDGPQLKEKCLKDAVFGRLALIHIWIKSWVGFGDQNCIAEELGGAFLSLCLHWKKWIPGKVFLTNSKPYFSTYFPCICGFFHTKQPKQLHSYGKFHFVVVNVCCQNHEFKGIISHKLESNFSTDFHCKLLFLKAIYLKLKHILWKI